MIQQNASAAEEMSSTAEELASQSEQLQTTIDFFKIAVGAQEGRSAARPPVKRPVSKAVPRKALAAPSGTPIEMNADAEFERF